MDDVQVCREILKLLNQFANEHGLNRYGFGPKYFLENLNIPENQLKVNIDFLEEEGYIKLLKALGSHFKAARLTSRGKKLFMNPSEFNRAFPATSITYINGNNNITGNNVSVNNSFNKIDKAIEASDLDDNLKNEIKDLVIDLINDINSKKLDDNKLKNFFSNIIAKTSQKAVPEIATSIIKSLLAYFNISS
ncbi:hypothetical protein [Maledivibacter halophilus]|uniref:Uncharacterized protein n=1 Tax=Maledivibacter halophilus TaxID=36842 RepID=A0A1T5KXR0_9FIRM|nr:hypothetical protein [Maledivibacter halophilus]SKC68602.1 hypothetical protein SAMN02194393_02165 [Maledivibacter halophilus]SKC71569.1 hypothetical protein SAMN02194393_02487 [Maledivibacter halophilus]SKC80271.1 hypothetical protein SAMN02194393_03476 [Maledivibacter halophilus]